MNDWIKMRMKLVDDPPGEVLEIARLSGAHPAHVVGGMLALWSWFVKNTADGVAHTVTHERYSNAKDVTHERYMNSRGVTRQTIAAHIEARAGIKDLLQHAETVGWLRIEDDKIIVVNFSRHMAQISKTRALTSNRVKKHRSKNDVTHERYTKRKGVTHDRYQRREEERRVDINEIASAISCDQSHGVTPDCAPEPTTKRAATTPRKPRPPDPIWDAVAAIWFAGKVIPGQATRVGRIVRDLKELEATPDAIADRHARQRDEWGDNGATPESLVKHWHQFGPDRKPPNGRHEEPSPARIQAEPGKYDHIRPINAKGKT